MAVSKFILKAPLGGFFQEIGGGGDGCESSVKRSDEQLFLKLELRTFLKVENRLSKLNRMWRYVIKEKIISNIPNVFQRKKDNKNEFNIR